MNFSLSTTNDRLWVPAIILSSLFIIPILYPEKKVDGTEILLSPYRRMRNCSLQSLGLKAEVLPFPTSLLLLLHYYSLSTITLLQNFDFVPANQYHIGLLHYEASFNSTNCSYIPIVNQPHARVSQIIYFCITLCMFRMVSPSITRSSGLYIQQQAYVKQILLRAC
jgi:hypothetical protein